MIDAKKSELKFSIDDIRELEQLGEGYWSAIMQDWSDDISFSYGTGMEQWEPKAIQARGGRPIDTYNIVNGFIKPVVNLAKQNPPAITVNPISDGASKSNARLLSGIIRSIEYGCGAQREYCAALDSAARGGLGILRLIPQINQLDDEGDVEFIISNVKDCANVLIDPSALKSDFSDAQWVIIKSTMSARQYQREYPDGKAEASEGIVDINELWIKHISRVDVYDEVTMQKSKKTKIKIIQYIYDAHEILEVIDSYPGKYLPFAIITGPTYESDNGTKYQSFTRQLKGVQKEINFLKSEMIASIACAPKNTFFGDNDALDENELPLWEEAATNPRVYLGHKPGATIQQMKQPEIPTAYIESVDKNIDIARIITGIYPDPTLQNGLNAVSGKALKQQQAGQSVATYEYIDSMNYAIKHIGEILLDLLPHYWNNDRVRLSMGSDGQYTPVSMGPNQVQDASNFDLSYGKYQVSISVGPSYSNQKDALIETVMDAVKTNPQALSVSLPWLINNINLPGSEELSDMFTLLLPENIQKYMMQMKQNSDDPEAKLKAAMLQLQQMQQKDQTSGKMIDQLTQALQSETAQLKSKQDELEMKKQMNDDNNHMKLLLQDMQQNHEREIADIKARMETLHILATSQDVEDETARKLTMNEQIHQHNLEDIALSKSLDGINKANSVNPKV